MKILTKHDIAARIFKTPDGSTSPQTFDDKIQDMMIKDAS